MMFVRSFKEIPRFLSIQKKTWPPMAILVSDWPGGKNICPETKNPNDLRLVTSNVCEVLCK
jgi:hypothetical protein